MRSYPLVGVVSLCLVSVLRANNSVHLAQCERDVGNCEKFSFRRIQPNVSITVNLNRSSNQKNVKTKPLYDLGIVENRIVNEETHIQENGNFAAIISHDDPMRSI